MGNENGLLSASSSMESVKGASPEALSGSALAEAWSASSPGTNISVGKD